MYGQILTNKHGAKVKVLLHYQDIYIISFSNEYEKASDTNYTKQDLISYGWTFPVEKWVPETGNKYSTPSFTDEDKYDFDYWDNDKTDRYRLANNLVCRTEEEAIALTDKMLGAVTN